MWHRSAKEATERTGEADHNETRDTGGAECAGLDNKRLFQHTFDTSCCREWTSAGTESAQGRTFEPANKTRMGDSFSFGKGFRNFLGHLLSGFINSPSND
jgi:hypothetical protein